MHRVFDRGFALWDIECYAFVFQMWLGCPELMHTCPRCKDLASPTRVPLVLYAYESFSRIHDGEGSHTLHTFRDYPL